VPAVRDTPRRPDPNFADLYASLPDATDLEPWLGWARQAKGPVFYLGAGAGRLAVPLTTTGVELVLVDAHPGMIEILRRRLPTTETIQSLIEELALSRRFDLVIGPSGILGRLTCLRVAARHLAPTGRLALQLANPYWLRENSDPRVRVRWETRGRVALEVDYPGGYTHVARVPARPPEDAPAFLVRAGLSLEWMGGSADGAVSDSPTYYATARLR
jgi:SAM-dependent methyltransferase